MRNRRIQRQQYKRYFPSRKAGDFCCRAGIFAVLSQLRRETESFVQAFSKACRVQRQRLWRGRGRAPMGSKGKAFGRLLWRRNINFKSKAALRKQSSELFANTRYSIYGWADDIRPYTTYPLAILKFADDQRAPLQNVCRVSDGKKFAENTLRLLQIPLKCDIMFMIL